MGNAKILVSGALALAAVLVVTAFLIAVAPYVAVVIVITGICWYAWDKEETPPPGKQAVTVVPTKQPPGE
jgi:Flp pilus assembly protein TadB